MQNKNTKTIEFRARLVKKYFTDESIIFCSNTLYERWIESIQKKL
jgi:hypothetical protein